MKRRPSLTLLIPILALLSISCSLSQVSQLFGAYPQNSGDLLFQDGFSDPSSGWDRVQNQDGVTDYENGRYRILINATNADYWTNPGLYFKDVLIDVDAGKIAGPDDNSYGVLCRYQDVNNFYFMIISSDGYYGVGVVRDGQQRLLDPPQMYHAESIIPGSGANHIQATCQGSHLKLQVNGDLLAEVEDATFQDGDIGLIVGSFDQAGVDVWFDNLMVRNP